MIEKEKTWPDTFIFNTFMWTRLRDQQLNGTYSYARFKRNWESRLKVMLLQIKRKIDRYKIKISAAYSNKSIKLSLASLQSQSHIQALEAPNL